MSELCTYRSFLRVALRRNSYFPVLRGFIERRIGSRGVRWPVARRVTEYWFRAQACWYRRKVSVHSDPTEVCREISLHENMGCDPYMTRARRMPDTPQEKQARAPLPLGVGFHEN